MACAKLDKSNIAVLTLPKLLRFSFYFIFCVFSRISYFICEALVITKALLIRCSEEVRFSRLLFCSLVNICMVLLSPLNSWVMSSIGLVSNHWHSTAWP